MATRKTTHPRTKRKQPQTLPEPAPIHRHARDQAEQCARLADTPATNPHAAGIDVGDTTHWVCVEATPDGTDTVREFFAHTPGLRQLVAWLRSCGVATVALEASGAYGHVLYLSLLEAGFHLMRYGMGYVKQTEAAYAEEVRDRLEKQLRRRAKELGFEVKKLEPTAAPTTS